ncbi:deacetylase Atu3266-like isoform X1 [Biomphalaria glabrata]|uniref:Deacetylase Atu3266-like n=2 Tax=Biomphalaria glabrata TaxID=6526 RepID=A0A9W2YMV4_BIOGL|nr:deacetylase Atu3266-like [Biomphalaria glabrata]KAI8737536.1 deacetylase [Biomphalaria glabrata]
MSDFVIQNGRVIDTALQINEITNVYVSDGCIASIGNPPDGFRQWSLVNASGCIVTPGLIDIHVHAYEYATPLGINVDRTCLAKGVTAVVDAGSAGASTFPGLRKFIAEKSKTRVYSFLHIVQHGLASAGCVMKDSGGECDSLNAIRADECIQTINENRDMIVGVKLRLGTPISNNGQNEEEAYRRALQASRTCGVPLMVHHSMSSIGHGDVGKLSCPGDLRAGDIYTHCFHGHSCSIVDDTGAISKHCLEAKTRGVLFDIGHGQGSFMWSVAEKCIAGGFLPDTISTDLHSGDIHGPAYDLLCVMSKLLHVGMGLEQVIAAVTSTPARAIGKEKEIGSLGVGMNADITILKIEDVLEPLEDCAGEIRTIRKAFTPVAVYVGGQEFPVSSNRAWPNTTSQEICYNRMVQMKADAQNLV